MVMRDLPTVMKTIIDSGDFTGQNRATARVTIQKIQLGALLDQFVPGGGHGGR